MNGENKHHKSHNKIDAMKYIDSVPSNVQSARQEALMYVFEDNEAVIKMIIKGRSPTMRHVELTELRVVGHLTWLCCVCGCVCVRVSVCWGERRGVCIEHVSECTFKSLPDTTQHTTHQTHHNTTTTFHATPPHHHKDHSTQHNTTPHPHHTHKSYASEDGGVELVALFASTRENSPGLDTVRIDRLFVLY